MNGARVFLLAALVGMSLPAENSQVSIQIVNPDASTSIRVFLDRKLIHEGTPARSSLSPNPTIPAVAGTFALDSTVRHVLTAEAPATHTKAQLEWTPRLDGSAWVVIRYYPGRSEPGEPPFFTFYLAKMMLSRTLRESTRHVPFGALTHFHPAKGCECNAARLRSYDHVSERSSTVGAWMRTATPTPSSVVSDERTAPLYPRRWPDGIMMEKDEWAPVSA